jgi:hypothetical protein
MHLAFAPQPAGAGSGSPFATDPQVDVENSSGVVNTAWTGSVTFTLSGGQFSGCLGQVSNTVVTVTATAGIATLSTNCDFSGGYFYNPNSSPSVTETQYTMSVTATPTSPSVSAVPATSNAFAVTGPGAPTQLAFVVEPTGVGNSSPTAAFPLNPQVEVEDAFGNIENTFTTTYSTPTISMAMYLGTPTTTSETLNGCTPSFSNGIYTFTNCSGKATNIGLEMYATGSYVNSAHTTVQLTASTSTPFNITGAASKLVFTQQPIAGASGSAFTQQPILQYEDSGNNVVTAATSSLTATAPGGGTLSSCTNLAPTLGIITVANCTFAGLDTVQNTYYLVFTGGGLTSPHSNYFTPTGPGPAAQLAFVSPQPVAAAAGSVMTTQPTVQVEDSAGNQVSTSNAAILISSTGNGVVTNCTDLTALAGTVNASSCTFGGSVGTTYYLVASTSSGNLTAGQSGPIQVTGPGPVAAVNLTTGCPSSVTLTSYCTFTATLEDAFANVETADFSSVVSFAIAPTSGFSGLANVTASAGVANETGRASATGYASVSASSDGFTSNSVVLLVNSLPSITTTSLPSATQTQTNYSQTLAATGGTPPYAWSISSGSLPTGLTLNSSTGVISGAVSSSATSQTFTATVTDADGIMASQSLTITVNVLPTISTTSLAASTQTQTTYSQTLAGTGGTTPYSWSVTTGSLPSGLTLNASTGVISGIVGASATTQTFTVTLSDANGVKATKSLTLTVNTKPSISPTTLPNGTRTGTYSQTVSVSGGTTPFGSWSISSGALPTGVISGTIGSAATTSTFTVSITDANAVVATQSLTITINAAPSISTTTLANATQTGTYSQTLAGTGGTTPYAWSVTTGILPNGLTLNATSGIIAGTVGSSAASETFTVTLTDADGVTATKSLTITVSAAPNIVTTSLAPATQTETGYSQGLGVSGGTGAFTWSLSSGTLPSGLTLGSTTGVISGTVGGSAATSTFTVKATDANGAFDTQVLTLTVNAVPTITTTSLPGATKTGAYSQTLAVTGGTSPFTWSLNAGILPAGLTLDASTGIISGTVSSSAVAESFTVKATDNNGVADTQALSIAVNGTPSITTTSLSAATQNQTGYAQTVSGTGGTTFYTWTVTTGILPAGLSLNPASGVISGTVGASAVNETFTVTLTDANSVTATKSLTITVNAAPNITTTTLPGGTKTSAYSQTLAETGGTTPLTWSVTTGILPAGLTIGSTTGTISGTISASASSETFTVTLDDANAVTDTQVLTITVNSVPSITTTTLPNATQTGTYSQTLAESGGTAPVGWAVTTGILPSGLTLGATTGVISGTVGASATNETFTVTLTDADNLTSTKSLTIAVNAAPSITTTTVATATQTEAGYSAGLVVTGGTTPFTWTVSSGTLPSGLTISSTTGTISGTVGASAATSTFTVKATDANGAFDTQVLTLTVNAAPNITTTTLPNGTKTGAYSQTLAVTGGTGAITWSVSSGTLPNGLTLNATTGVLTGPLSGTAATSTFTVKATDVNGASDTQVLTLTVNAAPVILTTSPLPAATQTQTTYSQTLAVSGGTANLNWTVTTGILPAGLTLNSGTGVISGTVSGSAVSETFTVTVTDANGVSTSKSLAMTVNTVPTITTSNASTIAATRNTNYNPLVTFAASGGTGAYTWSISSGSIGTYTLSSTTGAVSGRENTSGTLTFTVKATDANGVATTKAFTITVS